MAEEDEDKTTFFTREGVYCYRKMPFGLKNTGAMYQRLVDKVFNDQIGRNLEAYVDDMVIKSTSKEDPIMSRAIPPIPPPFGASSGNSSSPNANRVDTIPTTTDPDNRKEVERKTNIKLEETKLSCEWKLYTDEASSSDGSRVEYEALFKGLRIAQEMEILNLEIFVDSQLLVNQVKGIYATKQPAITEYLQKTKETLRRFGSYMIEHVRINQNKNADALSKLALMTFEYLTKEVLVKVLMKRSIEEKEVL
nr:hypothetical protein [Tanacetum cinerariifolium]